ncbi:MAG TPA: ABC transporter substrate-binding protein, partial [Chloroflexota bacterium]
AYTVRIRTSFTFEHLEFNVARQYKGKKNPLADRRVRQALALALDRQGLIRTSLRASIRTAVTMAAWSLYVHTPDLNQPGVPQPPDGQWDPIVRRYVVSGTKSALADARKLLNQTPYKGGFTLDLATTSGSNIRQSEESVLATNWAKLRIKLNTTFASSAKLLAGWSAGGILAHGDFQAALFAYLATTDPQAYRYNLVSAYCSRSTTRHQAIDGNNGCIHDSLIDRYFADAGRNLDASARAADYNAIQIQVNRQAYWVPLYFWPTMATDDGQVLNFSLNPTQTGATWNIAAWAKR